MLLTVFGVSAARRWREAAYLPRQGRAWTVTLTAGGALLLLSGWINSRGACDYATRIWNASPVSVDQSPGRLWDWRYPQFLAGLVAVPAPEVFPHLPAGREVSFADNRGSEYLLRGWSAPEMEQVWTNANQAVLIFATEDRRAATLRMNLRASVASPCLPRQRMAVRLNDWQIASLTITDNQAHDYSFEFLAGTLQEKNYLVFDLPDAVPLSTVTPTDDPRRLGVAIHSLQLNYSAPATASNPQ